MASSPSLRPQSPLSPRYDPAARFEMLQPPSARNLHPRSAAAGNAQRRHPNASLKLPSLPRFHPANFPSQHSSCANTPTTGVHSPEPPVSPKQQQRLYSEAQKQLYLFHRETLAANQAGLTVVREKPVSPRLAPLGSPGPVTPLELEGQEGYLLAGARSAGKSALASRNNDLVEKLIEQEARRTSELMAPSPAPTTLAGQ